MSLTPIGRSGRFLCELALLGTACCTGCAQETKESTRPEVEAASIDATNASFLVEAEPVTQGEIGRVKIRASMPAQRVALDELAEVELSLSIAPGYHIYGEVPEESALSSLIVEYSTTCSGKHEFVKVPLPAPTEMLDGNPIYRDALTVPIPTTICSTERDELLLTIRVQYQACNDLACFPPEKIELNLPVNIRLNEARRHP